MRYDLTHLRMAIKKKKNKTENNKCWQVYIERWESCTQLMSVQNATATVEDSMVVPQKIKCGIITGPSNSTPEHRPKRIICRDLNRHLYIHVHSIIHSWQSVEEIKIFNDRWIDKQTWYVHAVEYYSTLKRKEILTSATTLVKLDYSKWGKKKDKHCLIPLI